MPEKVWDYRNRTINARVADEMAKKYSLAPVIAVLLLNRGIRTEDEVRCFLTKSMKYVHNPMLMPDMDKAAGRIKQAIENKEKIVIYGDYDVDGITSTVILYSFLESLGAVVEYYIPDRESEGYGINILAVNRMTKNGAKLLISVDCGITAVGEVELAKLQGMDVIITDHHTCQEKLPRAYAVINPKIADSTYPFAELAGVGVTLKLILACAMEMGLRATDCFNKYAPLAAIGTIADVVPMRDENRVIVNKGLAELANSDNAGLWALIRSAGLEDKAINHVTVAFGLAPRINAAGRMGDAGKAAELLLCRDSVRAEQIASELEKYNVQRKTIEQDIFAEAVEVLEQDENLDKKKVLVVSGEKWHHGVIGIVASRISELYYKPCIVISYDEDGNGKGSGRSVEGFNLFEALDSCSKILTKFGGHSAAAGIGIKKQDIDEFEAQINKYAAGVIDEGSCIRRVSIDCELDPALATIENAKYISRLEPFGEENETPVFSMCGVRVAAVSKIGADNKHLRMNVQKNGINFGCIGFGMGEYGDSIKPGMNIDVAFNLEVNSFRGEERVQLKLKDVRL